MLHSLLRRSVAATASVLLFGAVGTTAAHAQSQPNEYPPAGVSATDSARAGRTGAFAPEASTNGAQTSSDLQPLTEERIRAAQEAAREIVDGTLNRTNEALQRYQQLGENLRRRADDIADETLAESRKEVLDFLGIDPEGPTSLYYFVSYNMPLPMLRAYALEAMWAGGTLVLRGAPPGKPLAQFVTEDLRELVHDKGAAASISIDPRLFDAYGVTLVPTIVLTNERSNFECSGHSPAFFSYQGQHLSFDRCPPVPEDKYWKMTGAVTTDYALREFLDAGAASARPHLEALTRGFATGTRPGRVQAPYEGEWTDAISPEELLAVRRAVEAAGHAQQPPAPSTER